MGLSGGTRTRQEGVAGADDVGVTAQPEERADAKEVGLGMVGDDGKGGIASRDRRVVVVVVEEKNAPVHLVAGENGLAGRFEADRGVEVAEGAGTLVGGRRRAGQLDVGTAAVEGGHVRAHGEGAAELRDRLVGVAPALVDLARGWRTPGSGGRRARSRPSGRRWTGPTRGVRGGAGRDSRAGRSGVRGSTLWPDRGGVRPRGNRPRRPQSGGRRGRGLERRTGRRRSRGGRAARRNRARAGGNCRGGPRPGRHASTRAARSRRQKGRAPRSGRAGGARPRRSGRPPPTTHAGRTVAGR